MENYIQDNEVIMPGTVDGCPASRIYLDTGAHGTIVRGELVKAEQYTGETRLNWGHVGVTFMLTQLLESALK